MPTNQTNYLLLIKKSFRNLKLDSQMQSCWLLNFLRCLNFSYCHNKEIAGPAVPAGRNIGINVFDNGFKRI